MIATILHSTCNIASINIKTQNHVQNDNYGTRIWLEHHRQVGTLSLIDQNYWLNNRTLKHAPKQKKGFNIAELKLHDTKNAQQLKPGPLSCSSVAVEHCHLNPVLENRCGLCNVFLLKYPKGLSLAFCICGLSFVIWLGSCSSICTLKYYCDTDNIGVFQLAPPHSCATRSEVLSKILAGWYLAICESPVSCMIFHNTMWLLNALTFGRLWRIF